MCLTYVNTSDPRIEHKEHNFNNMAAHGLQKLVIILNSKIFLTRKEVFKWFTDIIICMNLTNLNP